jgi:hypothetical protein
MMVMFAVMIVVVMIMPVVVFVPMVMCVFAMPVLIIMGDMICMALQDHLRMEAGYAAPLIPAELQLPALKAQLVQLPDQVPGINAQVHQRPQGHIPGNPGGTLKM